MIVATKINTSEEMIVKRIVVAAAAAAFAFGLAGSASAEPTKIRLGWNQAPGHMASMTCTTNYWAIL